MDTHSNAVEQSKTIDSLDPIHMNDPPTSGQVVKPAESIENRTSSPEDHRSRNSSLDTASKNTQERASRPKIKINLGSQVAGDPVKTLNRYSSLGDSHRDSSADSVNSRYSSTKPPLKPIQYPP